MRNDFDIRKILNDSDTELRALKEDFIREASGADDAFDAIDDYFEDMGDMLDRRLESLLSEGKTEEAWLLVMQAYSQLSEDDLEDYDGNEIHEKCLVHMGTVAEHVTGHDEREEFLALLIWMEGNEELPGWLRSAASVVVHDIFDEPEFLTVIAEWYEKRYQEDPEYTGAFWRGKLRDIAERLGNDPKWLAACEGMDAADPLISDMVYAECIARRGDRRCLDVWNSVEPQLDLESENEIHLLYSILWARFDFYNENGPEEEAEKAEEALNDFIEKFADEDDCCCEDDECGCGHHHHEEEHECCCGHDHDHEEHESRCGHHHHDEDHECCCGHHHEN